MNVFNSVFSPLFHYLAEGEIKKGKKQEKKVDLCRDLPWKKNKSFCMS